MTRAVAISLSLIAAFAWSTYYLFVLWVTPGTAPSAILVYPFLSGGVAYALWAVGHHQGRSLGGEFVHARAWGRTGLLVGLQISLLATTYLAGPVDASLLSLLGDVVATPLLVAWWVVERRRQVTSPTFALGLVLSLAGGTLAIVGGGPLEAVPPFGWLALLAVPLTVAFYFVLSARDGDRAGRTAVVGQSMLGAALGCVLLAPLLPGGWTGLLRVAPEPLLLLLLNGVVSFFVAPLCYFRAIARVGLVLPPMLMTGIPVFTLLLSALVLRLAPAPVALLGVPIAVLGGLVALRSERAGAGGAATASP